MINHKFKIKQKLLIILVFLFTLNCSQNKDSYYFKFDNVEHYSIDIEEGELFDLETKKNLKKNEQLKIDIIINSKPEKFLIRYLQTGYIITIWSLFRHNTKKKILEAKSTKVYSFNYS